MGCGAVLLGLGRAVAGQECGTHRSTCSSPRPRGDDLLPHPVHAVGDFGVDLIHLLAATFFRASPGHQALGHLALAGVIGDDKGATAVS